MKEIINKQEEIPDAEISKISQLETILNDPKFFAVENLFFDLDGTLHNFRKTAQIGMDKVYEKILAHHSLEKQELQKVFAKIIEQVEKQAFSEGKTSYEYRTERFKKLLESFSINDEQLVAELVKLYGDAFEENLALAEDVIKTLENLSRKYKMYLITEGPLDAQMRSLQILRVKEFFEKVFTSGGHGKVKETGELFNSVVQELNLQKNTTIVIGDSMLRDIQGAKLAGLKSILVTTFHS